MRCVLRLVALIGALLGVVACSSGEMTAPTASDPAPPPTTTDAVATTSTTISTSTPNQMAVSSVVRPKSNASTTGKNTGMVSRIIDSESMTHPKIR